MIYALVKIDYEYRTHVKSLFFFSQGYKWYFLIIAQNILWMFNSTLLNVVHLHASLTLHNENNNNIFFIMEINYVLRIIYLIFFFISTAFQNNANYGKRNIYFSK